MLRALSFPFLLPFGAVFLAIVAFGTNGDSNNYPSNAKIIAKNIASNLHRDTYHLNNNKLSDKDAILIANALAKNTHLKRLDMRDNEIGDDGAQALALALQKNRVLEVLALQDNKITDTGARALVHVLQENKVLKKMYLYGNDIHPDYIYSAESCCLDSTRQHCKELHTWTREELKLRSMDHHAAFQAFASEDEHKEHLKNFHGVSDDFDFEGW
jgi:hypothetical protein